jgi:nucleotidyltransferase/DNA polymerase involved in DNA repair
MRRVPPRRRLTDLPGIGSATADDDRRLGITTVARVADADPDGLYERIQTLNGPTNP